MAKWKADQVIALIEEHRGNVAAVARALGVARRTVLRYADDHPTVRQAIDEARETMIDDAESVLYTRALAGETAELIFFLKTQGRKRGYVERMEHAGPDGNAIPMEAKLTLEGVRHSDGEIVTALREMKVLLEAKMLVDSQSITAESGT